MANIAAIANGAWTSTSTWSGGVVPGTGDVAYANTFTVTISSTVTVQALSNAAATGITVGGSFQLQNGANVTCTNANGILQGTAAANCITTSLSVGQSATLSASISTTTGITAAAINHSTAGSLYLIGNYAPTVVPANNALIFNSGSGYLEIVGNVTGQTTQVNNATSCVQASGSGSTTKIIGNVTGSTAAGGSQNRGALISNAGATLLIIGTVQGGTPPSQCYGAENTSTAGILSIEGTCRGGTGSPAVGLGAWNSQITRVTGPLLLSPGYTVMAISAISWRFQWQNAATYMEVPTVNPVGGGIVLKNLYTADNMPVGGYPIVGNVRSGTVYGPSSEFIGTLAVPAAGSVALGVPVDNTTGTAVLSAANVRSAIGMASANLDSQLAPKATVDQVASIVQNSVSS